MSDPKPICPDCGSPLDYDEGEPETYSHPGQEAAFFCSCGYLACEGSDELRRLLHATEKASDASSS